eukprot:1196144-Prorocentrum_minimum.AAC.3
MREADRPACYVSGPQGESSGRKWGTGHRVRKGKRLRGVECILPVIGTGGPVKRSSIITHSAQRRSARRRSARRRSRVRKRGSSDAV